MGRYYTGDIEGKFWFGVQSSGDLLFFGGVEEEPHYTNYYFDKEDLPDIEAGIKTCFKQLGKNKAKLDEFFALNNWYNDEMLVKAGFKEEQIRPLLEWYARLGLGEKILKCVKEKGKCFFEAEL
jgi:hypothetical protein